MEPSVHHEGTFNGSPRIDPELLVQELRSGRRVVVLDVRNKDEFCNGHIEGARFIPIHQLVARSSELAEDHATSIVVVSQTDIRSRIAAASLRLAGFCEIAVLTGGLVRWRELGFPVVTATARRGKP